MRILRDCWRRTAFARYFEALDPIDRQTFWVGVALALALGLSIQAIASSREAAGDARIASTAAGPNE
jgi:hypothetical protein